MPRSPRTFPKPPAPRTVLPRDRQEARLRPWPPCKTVADENNLRHLWQYGQAKTQAAISVKVSNAAAKRAQLQTDLLDDAQMAPL